MWFNAFYEYGGMFSMFLEMIWFWNFIYKLLVSNRASGKGFIEILGLQMCELKEITCLVLIYMQE